MFGRWTKRKSKASRRLSSSSFRRLRGERLEDRHMMAAFNWITNGDGDFGVAANWLNTTTNTNGVPGPTDDANIPGGVIVDSNVSRTVNSVNGTGALHINAGTFSFNNTTISSTLFGLVLDSSATLRVVGGSTAVIGSEISGTVNTLGQPRFVFSGA